MERFIGEKKFKSSYLCFLVGKIQKEVFFSVSVGEGRRRGLLSVVG